MRHLDERISDLVDGRLDHDERDKALVHLTVCEACREAVELERHARNALRSLPDAVPSAQLMQDLLALAEPGGPVLPRSSQPGAPAPVAAWRPRDSRPRGGPNGASSRPGQERRTGGRGRAMRVLALGTGSTAAVLLLLASLGGSPNSPDSTTPPASIVPPLDQFTVEHARSTGGLPFVPPASLLVTDTASFGAGW